MGGATFFVGDDKLVLLVSIHAPHGGRLRPLNVPLAAVPFQSMPPHGGRQPSQVSTISLG